MQKSSWFDKIEEINISLLFWEKYFSQYLIKTLHIWEKLKNNVSKLSNLVILVISSSSNHLPLVWTEVVPAVVVAGVLE